LVEAELLIVRVLVKILVWLGVPIPFEKSAVISPVSTEVVIVVFSGDPWSQVTVIFIDRSFPCSSVPETGFIARLN
jgi:hypothetical protein